MKFFVLMTLVLLGACSRPVLNVGLDPSDPAAPVPAVKYVPLTSETDYTPVGPKPWIEQNTGVAPRPRSGE